MLPKQIATELNVNKNVNSELFDQVTVFFSEMADFTNICSRLSAQDVSIVGSSGVYSAARYRQLDYNVLLKVIRRETFSSPQ